MRSPLTLLLSCTDVSVSVKQTRRGSKFSLWCFQMLKRTAWVWGCSVFGSEKGALDRFNPLKRLTFLKSKPLNCSSDNLYFLLGMRFFSFVGFVTASVLLTCLRGAQLLQAEGGPVLFVSSGLDRQQITYCQIPGMRSWGRRRGISCKDLLNKTVVNGKTEDPPRHYRWSCSALLLRLISRSVTSAGA